MKKHWATRVLGALGALAATGMLALGLGESQGVQAEATTQHVILTKYGFSDQQTEADHETDQKPEDAAAGWAKDATALAGVKFTVYDVTTQYWAAPDSFNPDATKGTVVATMVTDDNGQAAFDLPQISNEHNAVYLFREVQPHTGYDANSSADFWLSLPAKAAADGNVYVYPKNKKVTTHFHKFIKQDANTHHVLQGAEFKIQNTADKQYLVLVDSKDQPVAAVTGFVDNELHNYHLTWDTDATKATVFTSDDNGAFGLNGFAAEGGAYEAIETKAPSGYERAENTGFAADGHETVIDDQPTGLLPHTGGAGIVGLLVAGLALIALTIVGIKHRQNRA